MARGLNFHSDGTSDILEFDGLLKLNPHSISGSTLLTLSSDATRGSNCFQVIRNDYITSGASILQLNGAYLWVDATGKLRIIAGLTPLADLSGAVVGSQS
jgi:hypothetical protein